MGDCSAAYWCGGLPRGPPPTVSNFARREQQQHSSCTSLSFYCNWQTAWWWWAGLRTGRGPTYCNRSPTQRKLCLRSNDSYWRVVVPGADSEGATSKAAILGAHCCGVLGAGVVPVVQQGGVPACDPPPSQHRWLVKQAPARCRLHKHTCCSACRYSMAGENGVLFGRWHC